MSQQVKKLTARVVNARISMLTSLSADLAEASKRMQAPTNSRITDDTKIYNDAIAQIIRLHINQFTKIINNPQVQQAVNNISKSAATLKKEAKKVDQIANTLTKWNARISTSTNVVTEIRKLI